MHIVLKTLYTIIHIVPPYKKLRHIHVYIYLFFMYLMLLVWLVISEGNLWAKLCAELSIFRAAIHTQIDNNVFYVSFNLSGLGRKLCMCEWLELRHKSIARGWSCVSSTLVLCLVPWKLPPLVVRRLFDYRTFIEMVA